MKIGQMLWPPNISITPWSINSIGSSIVAGGGSGLQGLSSAVYPSSNLAIYIPFFLVNPAIANLLWWGNGATVSGNVDIGIYSSDGTRIVSSGSTAQASISVIQSVDITDTLLGPGQFYLALACDNVTATFYRGTAGAAAIEPCLGIAEQATAFPLPATATFASATNNYIPHMGIHFRTLI